MSKIILKGYIVVPDSDISAVKVELINHIQLTRQESGCLIFNVSQDEEHKNKFSVYEEFKDQESFDNHQNRARESKWAIVTKNVERHYEITDS